jgi:mono/diheme cytochrome c family protein
MKKRIAIGAAGVLAVLIAIIVSFVGYSVASFPPTWPDTPHPDLKASTDPEIIAKGKYLADAVAHCTICHTKEEDFIGNPDVSGMIPSGGHEWVLGPMGTLRSANITSDVETGIGGMSDAELARILKHAVRPNDEPALMMVALGPMVDEDIVAIMSYVRSLPAVKNKVPRSDISVMGKVMLPQLAAAYVAPKPAWELPPKVEEGEVSVGRGKYLMNGPGFCFVCHSNLSLNPELAVVGPRFAGCVTPDPDPKDDTMEMCAPNLTPDPETGHIRDWSEDAFVQRFRAGRTVEHSPMPWENYRLMTDADLRSLYQYLQTVPPTNRLTGPGYRKVGWTPDA